MFAPAEIERGNAAWLGSKLFNECNDGKVVALGAFEFDPIVNPPGTVDRLATLADDTFQPHVAGVLKYTSSFSFEIPDIDQLVGRARKHVLEKLFAFDVGYVA